MFVLGSVSKYNDKETTVLKKGGKLKYSNIMIQLDADQDINEIEAFGLKVSTFGDNDRHYVNVNIASVTEFNLEPAETDGWTDLMGKFEIKKAKNGMLYLKKATLESIFD